MAFTLPKLPYEYDSLEPSIDAQTMQIHYSKHHNVSWTLDLPKRHCLHVTLPSCDVCMHWHVIIYMCAAATWSSTLVLLCLNYRCAVETRTSFLMHWIWLLCRPM